jgi:hypothetical protein
MLLPRHVLVNLIIAVSGIGACPVQARILVNRADRASTVPEVAGQLIVDDRNLFVLRAKNTIGNETDRPPASTGQVAQDSIGD